MKLRNRKCVHAFTNVRPSQALTYDIAVTHWQYLVANSLSSKQECSIGRLVSGAA
jgi:hypothetical protein